MIRRGGKEADPARSEVERAVVFSNKEFPSSLTWALELVFARAGNLLAELLAEIFNCSASSEFSAASSK